MTAPRPRCTQCGPGYRIGDEGCRHVSPTPDALGEIERVLGEHWEMEGDSDAFRCTCGYGLSDRSGDLDGRHRAHVARALLPVLADSRAEAAREAWREAADEVHREARYQYEMHRRHAERTSWIWYAADRLSATEAVLRARADRIGGEQR